MDFYTVLTQIMILFLILIAGYLARKLNWVGSDTTKGLTSLLLNIALPALIINSLQADFSSQLLRQSGQVLIIAFAVYLASFIVAIYLPKLIQTPKSELGVFRFALLFSNVGFMGYPVTQAVYGDEGLFYAAIYNLPFSLLVFTVGIVVINLGKDKGKQHQLKWSMFVTPATVSVLIGFILFIFSIPLPTALAKAIQQVGDTTTPLSMILVGIILAQSKLSSVFSNWRVYFFSLVRLLGIPLILWLVLRAVLTNTYLIGIPVLIAAMPAAANTAILAQEYDANPELASQIVFISTLLSIVTIPLLVTIMQ